MWSPNTCVMYVVLHTPPNTDHNTHHKSAACWAFHETIHFKFVYFFGWLCSCFGDGGLVATINCLAVYCDVCLFAFLNGRAKHMRAIYNVRCDEEAFYCQIIEWRQRKPLSDCELCAYFGLDYTSILNWLVVNGNYGRV